MIYSGFRPDHVHFLATATLQKRQQLTVDIVKDWLIRMVDAVGMQIMDGPHVKECFDKGNEGVTGVVVLSTSHCSIHIWDQCVEPYLKMDLYSCRRSPIDIVLKMLRELDVRVCDYQVIDRNHRDETALLSGSMARVDRGVVDFRKSPRILRPNTVVWLWTAIARLLAWR